MVQLQPPHGTRLPLRGLMLDAARLVERPEYYRRFFDFCGAWGINAVLFRLTDDQGCAMRFRSHPELVTHPNALAPAQVAALADYAQAVGIDLIPEIESLGHSRYITQAPEHAALNDHSAEGEDWANGLIPLHPHTLRILGDLYAEVADLFPSGYLHTGCDETNWGGSAFSRQLLATRSRAQVWGEYLNALHERVRALGREMIIWDDMVLRHDPTILDHLDRRIILHDWEYAETTPASIATRLTLALDKGFRVIGGPALMWCKWGPRAGGDQLANIEAYADVYRDSADARALGVIVTNWVPSRYLQSSIWDGLAYAATALAEGGMRARDEAFPRFIERHYVARWDSRWAAVFSTLYACAPSRETQAPTPLHVPWSRDDAWQQARQADAAPASPWAALLPQLDRLGAEIHRHQADFAAFRLSVAYLAHLEWRHAAARETAGAGSSLLPEIARRDAALAEQLRADWHTGREGDCAGDPPPDTVWGFEGPDRLHWQFLQAARFSAEMLEGA
ncbi:MAG: family 20 glycosylhydrolase [Armatimonadota bacterium]